jgi:hypothetical protein
MAASLTAPIPFAAVGANGEGSPIFGVKIPGGYRGWELIAVSREQGLDEIRGILGNATALKSYQDGTLPFPDGTVLAKLAWKHQPLAGVDEAFVTGPATTVSNHGQGTQRNTRRPAAEESAVSSTANPSMKLSTRHASPVTRPTRKDTTSSLRTTHLEG